MNNMSEFSTLNGYKVKDKKAIRFYDNVELMKSDTTLKEGMYVKTKGYYDINDGGGAEYMIDNISDDYSETLSNELCAKIILKNNEINPLQLGAKCNGIDDDAIIIRKALNLLSSKNGGTLNLLDNKTYTLNSLETNTFIMLKNNCNIKGNSTLKVADNFGEWKSLFNYNENINKLRLEDFTIDDNTTNNPKTAETGTGTNYRTDFYFAQNQNFLNNVLIKNIHIKDCIGKWQFTTHSIANNIIIDNMIIDFNSTESLSYDRTSIYFGVNNGIVKNCTLNGNEKGFTAIELHGSNINIENNFINDYAFGILPVHVRQSTDILNTQNINNNTIITLRGGIIVWNAPTSANTMKSLNINNNLIRIKDNELYSNTHDSPLGIYDTVSNNAIIENLIIKNNTIINEKPSNYFFRYNFGASGQNSYIKNLILSNNNFYGYCINPPFMLVSQYYNKCYIENLEFNNNIIEINSETSYLFQLYLNESNKSINFKNNNFIINETYSNLILQQGDASNSLEFNFIDNITNVNFSIDRVVRCNGDVLPLIKHKFKQLILTNQNVKNLLTSEVVKMKNGSCLEDNNITIKKLNDIYSLNYIGDILPKHIPIYKGTQFQLLNSSNFLLIATTDGYMPDHEIGTNNTGDWVLYDGRVYESLTDNTLTTASDDNINFKRIGMYPTLFTVV
nr:MAG TPA: outer surface protein [Caudoviricetes sp.]